MFEDKSSAFAQPAGKPAKGRQAPRRILVVDDDEEIRQFSTEVLIHHGYQVDAAANGVAAWKILQARRYDLLVTDNEMEQGSGVELLTKLHAVRKPLPTIMATGSPPKELAEYPWLKPAALLLKPYTATEFLQKVREVLRVAEDAGCI